MALETPKFDRVHKCSEGVLGKREALGREVRTAAVSGSRYPSSALWSLRTMMEDVDWFVLQWGPASRVEMLGALC